MTLIVILLLVIVATLLLGARLVRTALLMAAAAAGGLLLFAVGILTAPAWLDGVLPVLWVAAVAGITAIVLTQLQARTRSRARVAAHQEAEAAAASVDIAALLQGSAPLTAIEKAALLAEQRRLSDHVLALCQDAPGKTTPAMAEGRAAIVRINERLKA